MACPKISITGAVVVVTGGARGIGKATADLFAAHGATVCAGDLDGAEFSVDAVIDRHGRIDVLVNKAVGLSASVREEYRDSGVSVTAVLPSAVRTRLASGVPLGRGLPTVEPEAVVEAVVRSVTSRRAEITVPRWLAGWDLLDAATPSGVMTPARRAIEAQARGRR